MFKDLRPYEEPARATDLPWASHVPPHWDVTRAKALLRVVDVRSTTGAEEQLTVSAARGVVQRSDEPVSMFAAASYVGHKLCWPDDLVVNSLWAWGRGLGVSPHHGIVSPAYGVYRPNVSRMNPNFLHALVRSRSFQWELQVRSQGVWKSRLQITDERFLATPLVVPPLAEQAAIVKYLAYAHRRIDRAITAKRKMITLLEEQKQAAVAAQLDRFAATARTVRLKNVASLQTGLTLGKTYPDGTTKEYPYLRVANVQSGSLDLRRVTTVAVPPAEAGRCTLRAGDVLMTEGGDIDKLGRATLWRSEIDGCLHQNHVFAVRCGPELDPEFLVLALATPEARHYFAVTAKKTTNLASTNSTTVREFRFLCPEAELQRAIVSHVAADTVVADAAIDRSRREIDLLQEFRTRLTADVVTGQLDVRHIAATLPDLDPTDPADDVGGPDNDLDVEIAEVLEGVGR